MRNRIFSLALSGAIVLMAAGSCLPARCRGAVKSKAMQLKFVDDLLKANPNDANLHLQRAELLVFLRRFDEAIEESDRLINRNSRLRDAYIVKGRSLAGNKHYREAIHCLDMAFKLGAPSSKLLLYKADYLRSEQRFVEAIEILSKVIKVEPSNADAYESRARCYFNIQGRRKEALQDMEKVVSLKPGDAAAKGAVEALKRDPWLNNSKGASQAK